MMVETIPQLLQVAEDQRDTEWLQKMLRHAVKLEFSTIPPYLCAMWSIKNPNTSDPHGAYNLILSIVLQEMLHMGLACNMLTTIGGTPEINRDPPTYPGPLPGNVRPQLTVYLAGLSKDLVYDVFMNIEYPDWQPIQLAAEPEYKTIGAFYNAILRKFQHDPPPMTGDRQITMQISQNDTVFPIKTADDAVKAIQEIQEQGEGSSQSPLDSDPDGELAHYYRFAEIYHGNCFVVDKSTGKWSYDGPPVLFPDVYPMAPVPLGGYPDLLAERHFRQLYTTVLDYLQGAWAKGDVQLLNYAIDFMFALAPQAQHLMQIPRPDGSGNYGPDFQIYPQSAEQQG